MPLSRSLLLSATLAFSVACGPATTPLADAGSLDAGAQLDGGTDAGAGLALDVVSNGTRRSIDLSTLPTAPLGVKTVVKLDAVVQAAFPELVGTGFRVSFLASDGFDPASKANCATLVPLAESLLAQGGVDPLTRNLAWDDALGYPGCLYVHDCTTLTLAP